MPPPTPLLLFLLPILLFFLASVDAQICPVSRLFAGPIHSIICLELATSHVIQCIGAEATGSANPVPDFTTRVQEFKNVSQLAFSVYMACSLSREDVVTCIGSNLYGELGLGLKKVKTYYDFSTPVKLHSGLSVATIAANEFGLCVLYVQGQVSCWGFPGPLGDGAGYHHYVGYSTKTMGNALPFVNLGTHVIATQLVSGVNNNCVLVSTGAVKCWGWCVTGECESSDPDHYLGVYASDMGDNLPWIPLGTKQVASLSAGSQHMCALFVDGTATCWGAGWGLGVDSSQETVLSTYDNLNKALPQVKIALPIASLSAGYEFTCLLIALTGQIFCFGSNANGQLGTGDYVDRGQGSPAPYDMAGLAPVQIGGSATSLACSNGAVAVILDSNTVVAWGSYIDLNQASDWTLPQTLPLCVHSPTASPTKPPNYFDCQVDCLNPRKGALISSSCLPSLDKSPTQQECGNYIQLWKSKTCKLAPQCSLPRKTLPVSWVVFSKKLTKACPALPKAACISMFALTSPPALTARCAQLFCAVLPWMQWNSSTSLCSFKGFTPASTSHRSSPSSEKHCVLA